MCHTYTFSKAPTLAGAICKDQVGKLFYFLFYYLFCHKGFWVTSVMELTEPSQNTCSTTLSVTLIKMNAVGTDRHHDVSASKPYRQPARAAWTQGISCSHLVPKSHIYKGFLNAGREAIVLLWREGSPLGRGLLTSRPSRGAGSLQSRWPWRQSGPRAGRTV